MKKRRMNKDSGKSSADSEMVSASMLNLGEEEACTQRMMLAKKGMSMKPSVWGIWFVANLVSVFPPSSDRCTAFSLATKKLIPVKSVQIIISEPTASNSPCSHSVEVILLSSFRAEPIFSIRFRAIIGMAFAIAIIATYPVCESYSSSTI